ncbi:MAG: hypothetical protein R2718_10710 [Solirubrobacterales bacterium]
MPFYLRPSAPTAADALICGDPARALTIAQHVMVQPRMSNHNRGLWGYYGEAPSGRPLTVQATGIGAPSAVAVLAESADLGVTRVVRVGTCAAVGRRLWKLGAGVVVSAAETADGASRALGADGEARADPGLTAALGSGGLPAATVSSSDLLPGEGAAAAGAAPGLHDLQTAAVLTLARRLGLTAAAALVVRSLDGRRLEDEPLDAALLRLADAAVTALEATASGQS